MIAKSKSPFAKPPSSSYPPEQAAIFGPNSGQVELGASDNPIDKGTTMEKAALVKQDRVLSQQKAAMEKLAAIQSFDWRSIPPPVMAELLMQTPFRGSTGEPDYYLAPYQAYRFAIRAYELNLSPLSTEVWYNPKNNMTNATFEGKLKMARMNGMKLSPPKFIRYPEDLTKPAVAVKCIISTPDGDCEYTATLKEWRMNSPQWRDRPDHMLQIRAAEKCLSFATGSGSSELPGERDLDSGAEAAAYLDTPTNFVGDASEAEEKGDMK